MGNKKIRMLILSITGQCNFSCTYCYASDHQKEVMDFEIAKKAIDLLAPSEMPFVLQITGGEPLLFFSQVQKIITYVKNQKPLAQIQIQTNGSLITAEMADFFKKNQCGLGISLDGKPDINQKNRFFTDGRDPILDIVKGIQILKSAEVACGLTCVISKDNMNELEGILDFAYYLGNVRRVGFNLLKQSGRGKMIAAPSAEEIKSAMTAVYRRLSEMKKYKGLPIKVSQLTRTSLLADEKMLPFEHCFAMTGEGAFITPNGNIYACASLGDQLEYCWGNVNHTIDDLKREKISNQIRKQMNCCFHCEELLLCGGGCFTRFSEENRASECALKLTSIAYYQEQLQGR